jgi:hypothetical protein
MGDKKFDREYYLKCLQEVVGVCEKLNLTVYFWSLHEEHDVLYSTDRMMAVKRECELSTVWVYLYFKESFIMRIQSHLLERDNFLETFESEVYSVLLNYIFT